MRKAGDLRQILDYTVIDQASDDETLAEAQFDIGLHPPRGDRRDAEARYRDGTGSRDARHLRLDVKTEGVMCGDLRQKGEFDAVIAKLDGDGARIGPGLRHRNRKFAAGEETGFL